MKRLRLWMLPAGVGFALLLLIAGGVRDLKFTIGIFIISIAIWLLHESYRGLSGYPALLREIANNYHVSVPHYISSVEGGICDCCKGKSSFRINIEHNSKDKSKDLSVCIYCYGNINRLWKKIDINHKNW